MVIKAICKQCHAGFEISDGEQAWYAEHGWPVPKKCPSCRKEAKLARRKNAEKRKEEAD